MQQEFSCSERLVIADIAMGIGPDVGVKQESLAVLDDSIGVLKIGLAFTDRLDLGSAKGHAGFESVEQKVIVAGSAVDRRVALAGGDGVARVVFLRSLRIGVARPARQQG